MAAAPEKMDFEKSLTTLEEIVHQLETGELPLEEALAAFEKGIKLTREAQTALKSAEQKVQLLVEESGEIKAYSLTGSNSRDEIDDDEDGSDDANE